MGDLTASELLTAYDKFLSGAPISRADEATARTVAIAACFGVAAYDAQPNQETATNAMVRSFLLALINPAHSDLDYLRADPAAGDATRIAEAAILRALQAQSTPPISPEEAQFNAVRYHERFGPLDEKGNPLDPRRRG